MDTECDALVIGAGIIGTAIAYELSKRKLLVALCDQSQNLGDGISGRNSGVLHSGIYYPDDSLKLKVCIEGYALARSFFQRFDVPHVICGKLITVGANATNDAFEHLEQLWEQGRRRNLPGEIQKCDALETKYPGLRGRAGLWIAATGVVDVPAYLKILRTVSEEQGAVFLPHHRFNFYQGQPTLLDGHNRRSEAQAKIYINASGLESAALSRSFGLEGWEIKPNKGEYYRLSKPLPYPFLVYPLPHKQSTALGVHYTFHLGGDCYAGPSSAWADSKDDYSFTLAQNTFYESLQHITSLYRENDLSPGYVGLRPRLFFQGKPHPDFVLQEAHGDYRSLHLLGIESPGLTSALALAQLVAQTLAV